MATKYDDDVISIPNEKLSGGLFGAFQRQIASANKANLARTNRFDQGIPESTINRTSVAKPKLAEINTANQDNNLVSGKKSGHSLINRAMRESGIGKQGKFVTAPNGKPQWQGLDGGWLRDESTGETYAVGADKGNPMRRVGADGEIDTSFQERKLSRFGMKSPYEITDSTWTPEETDRFNRTPVHGGGRMISGNGSSGNSYSPNYEKSWNAQKNRLADIGGDANALSKDLLGPLRIDTNGFSGKAAKARAHTQRVNYQNKLAKLAENFTSLGMQEQGKTTRKVLGNAADAESRGLLSDAAIAKEAGINRRFGATQAFNKAKNDLARKDKSNEKNGSFKFVPDIDPNSGEKLSTGRFYNARTGEWKQEPQASSGDANADFVAGYNRK